MSIDEYWWELPWPFITVRNNQTYKRDGTGLDGMGWIPEGLNNKSTYGAKNDQKLAKKALKAWKMLKKLFPKKILNPRKTGNSFLVLEFQEI